MMFRRAILAFALLAGAAHAQAPPPVPALPDAERRISYTIAGTTCACSLGANLNLYGDGTDYQSWVEVFLNGVLVSFNDPVFGWTITSQSGKSLGSIALPITDGVLTFTNAQTGTVQIVGARRPRRVSQFTENQPIPARNLNQLFNDLIAQNREVWDKINDVTGRGIFGLPGETLAPLPPAATRANQGACFDTNGNLINCVSIPSSTFAAGAGITFTGTNPTTIATNLSAGPGIALSGTNPRVITNNIQAGAGVTISGTNPLVISAGISATSTVTGAGTTFTSAQNNLLLLRSNSGSSMSDVLPGTSPGILPVNTVITVTNNDTAGLLAISAGAGAAIKGNALLFNGFVYIGPGQTIAFFSDGAIYWIVNSPGRAKLAAATTINVSTSGSDTTGNGVTASFATTNKAYSFAQSVLDLNGFALTLQHATGNYPQAVNLCGTMVGQSGPTSVIVAGNTTTPSNVTFPGTGTGVSITVDCGAQVQLQGLDISSSGGQGVLASNGSVINFGSSSCASATCNIVGATTGAALGAVTGGIFRLVGNYTINGNQSVAWYAHTGGMWNVEASGLTVTLTGSLTFNSFANSDGGRIYHDFSVSFSTTTATGPRWSFDHCGSIISGGATYPGSLGGVSGACGEFS